MFGNRRARTVKLALGIVLMLMVVATSLTAAQSQDLYLPLVAYQPPRFVCGAQTYACTDFGTQPEAQEVFNYCMETRGFDVHQLDVDGDRMACEVPQSIILASGLVPTWSPDGSKIAYANGNGGIYVMNADGSHPTRLTDDNNSPNDQELVWSPDSRKLAFTTFQDGNWEIYVIKVDGSQLTNLTKNPGYDVLPTWSPDGRKIAFTGVDEALDNTLFVIDSDGRNRTRLTDFFAGITWSPTSRQIAFVKEEGAGRVIYVIDVDGSNLTPLTDNASNNVFPMWSPVGERIAYTSNRENSNFANHDIYVMDSDGSHRTKLTNTPGFDLYPAWSPDGQKLVFVRMFIDTEVIASAFPPPPPIDLLVMDADGSHPTRLTMDYEDEQGATWSPDGRKILYSRDGGIYVISVEE